MKLPISVFIIAKDEEDRISNAIQSVVSWVDEVVVIDSGSTDGTVNKAQSLGAKVIFNEWNGYGAQKIFGEGLCKNEWILNIDADEEVSKDLAQEIQTLMTENKLGYYAYYLHIKLITRNRTTPSLFAPRTDAVRLYNKTYSGFRNSTVHDSVIFRDGYNLQFGKLEGELYHRCFRSLKHAVEKINFYTDMQALDMLVKNKYPSALRIIFEPVLSFLKAYFIRRYCLYGVDGFIESVIYAFNRTLRLAKAREIMDSRRN